MKKLKVESIQYVDEEEGRGDETLEERGKRLSRARSTKWRGQYKGDHDYRAK